MAIQLPFSVVPEPLGTITTGNERAATPAVHLGEFADIGMVWRSNGTSNLWVRGDFGTASPVDFASLIWASAGASTTIRLRLGASQAAVDGTAGYDSGAVPFISPSISRTDGQYSSHLEIPAVQTFRWWRIDIGNPPAGVDFSAAKLILGRRLIPANYYSSGWQFGVEDLGDIDVGRWGVPDEQPGLIFRTLLFKLGWLSEADFETKMRPLVEQLGKRRVALWCFDPEPTAYRQAKTYLGWLRNPPAASGGLITGRYEMEFEILSMI